MKRSVLTCSTVQNKSLSKVVKEQLTAVSSDTSTKQNI